MRALSVAVIFALLLHGCQCGIPVSVRGSQDSGIVFTLRESREVTYAGVTTRDGMGQWKEIWRIEGEDDLVALRYGEATPGLSTTAGAQGLGKNQLYAFHIEDSNFWGPCVGLVMFVVTEEGTVAECGTEQCIRRVQ